MSSLVCISVATQFRHDGAGNLFTDRDANKAHHIWMSAGDRQHRTDASKF